VSFSSALLKVCYDAWNRGLASCGGYPQTRPAREEAVTDVSRVHEWCQQQRAIHEVAPFALIHKVESVVMVGLPTFQNESGSLAEPFHGRKHNLLPTHRWLTPEVHHRDVLYS